MFSFLTKNPENSISHISNSYFLLLYKEHGTFMEFFFVFCYASLTEVNNKFLMAGSEIITYERFIWEKI